ncbi:hypothetical protein [Absidia glauca]|uniref:BTB domain-containing protein n=1 Tax=Absidia glauca TaxID=4829 RepID=A0A168N9N6_ABSGL|nr:hypothetical protein [Absidia glauca]
MGVAITDLTTSIKKTFGQRPPTSLVGSTCTLVGDKVFVFGGSTQRTTNHLYILDLLTLEWQQHIPCPDSARPPSARAYHSATVYRQHYIIIFGGLGYNGDPLNDFRLFNTLDLTWVRKKPMGPSLFTPSARYGHVAMMASADRMVVLGGTGALHDYYVLDLEAFEWQASGSLDRPCHNINSVAEKMALLSDHTLYHLDSSMQLQVVVGTAPGLQYPQAARVGPHWVISGISTGDNSDYQVWSFHWETLEWTRIDTGVTGGQYGMHHINHWLFFLDFGTLVTVDLEAFGIYEPPRIMTNPLGCDLGQWMLKDPHLADVYVMTKDGTSIPANTHILALRWPYAATLFGNTKATVDEVEGGRHRHQPGIGKTLLLHESHDVVLVFLIYLYSGHLPLAPAAIVTRLSLLATIYHMPRLVSLATHALHHQLTLATASIVYEAATLTNQSGLQIRALRVMLKIEHQHNSSIKRSSDFFDIILPPPPPPCDTHPQSSIDIESFSSTSTASSGHAKFSWRKLQQSTLALAKPKPLRITASHTQPFYDL